MCAEHTVVKNQVQKLKWCTILSFWKGKAFRTQQSRVMWNALPLKQQSKSRQSPYCCTQLWNEKLQGITEDLLEKKKINPLTCEFKRDERNNQAKKCVPFSKGITAVVWIAMRILRRCLLSSLLLSCEVVRATVTRRCRGTNSAGPPKTNTWE